KPRASDVSFSSMPDYSKRKRRGSRRFLAGLWVKLRARLRPEADSLRLLPSGPDRVSERFARNRTPVRDIEAWAPKCESWPPHAVLAFGKRHEHTAQGLHFLIGETGAVDGGADRARHGVVLLGREEKSARVEFAFQMIEEVEQLLARGLAVNGPMLEARRRRGVARAEPFIGIEQHCLAEIDGGEGGSRNRDHRIGERDFVVVEAGALIAEQQSSLFAA